MRSGVCGGSVNFSGAAVIPWIADAY